MSYDLRNDHEDLISDLTSFMTNQRMYTYTFYTSFAWQLQNEYFHFYIIWLTLCCKLWLWLPHLP